MSTHIRKLNKGSHKNNYLQQAWFKHGPENFKFEIIEEVKEKLLEREQYYIDILMPYDNLIGYNILKDVGFTWEGVKHSRKTISKMSKSKYGDKNPMYGKGQSICQYDMNGVFLREFISVREASEFLGLKRKMVKKKNRKRLKYINTSLKKCLRNERPSAYGYKWEYPV